MFRRPVKERYIVLAISSAQAMDVETEKILSTTIESHTPTHWQLYNSHNFHVYFRLTSNNSTKRANNLHLEIIDLIQKKEIFKHFKIGINEGMLISEVNLIGGVSFDHLGQTVMEAYKQQKGKSELTGNA